MRARIVLQLVSIAAPASAGFTVGGTAAGRACKGDHPRRPAFWCQTNTKTPCQAREALRVHFVALFMQRGLHESRVIETPYCARQ